MYLAPLLLALALAASACGGIFASDAKPTATPAPPAATATPAGPNLTIFRGFAFPIASGCLPVSDALIPNAPREYRGGVHEGLDLYGYDNCTDIMEGTAALAGKDGTVIRADQSYHDLTPAELDAANARIARGEANESEVVDLFRGRQVWIDHGQGIVTRYAHLSEIPANIVAGVEVKTGDTVGYVGESGTPESLSAPGVEMHLHWELRTGESFLGAGLPPDVVRVLYIALFEPLP